MFTRILKSRLARRDDGMALVLVIGMGTILAILVVAAVGYAVSGISFSRSTQDTDGSLAAAYAGVEEFQSRLAVDPEYWKYGNSVSTFSSTSGSSVVAPPTANPAFGVGVGGTWATVPGSPSTSPAEFRYEVDNSSYAGSGIVRIRATGRVGTATRTLVADLKQQGFLDFLYFTDYEIRDPADSSLKCVPAYDWAVSSRPSCTTLQFAQADVINGPLHSNDTLLICGATFNGNVTTGKPTLPLYKTLGGCNTPTFTLTDPRYSPVVGMPATNSLLKSEMRTDLASVPKPGCLYTGPTTIVFTGSGQMTVRSPWTKTTNISGDPATSGSINAACGTPGAAGLGSALGVTVPVPTNNVVYVQNVPSATANPNYWPSSKTGSGASCKSFAGTSISGNIVGYPVSGELPPSKSAANPSYGCRNGDVFVEGNLQGQVTVASENYVYVTGDLAYVDDQKDMLGLVGQNSVFIWNPVRANKTLVLADPSRRVDAAILSVAHSFQVQNFTLGGTRGVLTVNGAIAQKFRGAVGTTSGNVVQTGYLKDYLYDTRFRYTAPPKFLSPVTTTYGVTVWVETERAFDRIGGRIMTVLDAIIQGAVVIIVGLLGLAVGSFINVVVWRVPRGQSVVHPPSACPKCRRPIRARDNVPVLSWLALSGRCRDCAEPISARYPLVESVTAALFVALAFRFDVLGTQALALPAFLFLGAIGVALALIDLDTHRLPNAIVLPAYPVALALLGVATVGSVNPDAIVRALVGGAAMFAFYFILAVAVPRGMGFGDVKLAGVLGLYLGWLGWGTLVVGGFAAFVLGGVFSIVLLLMRRAGRGSGIPFGPWMLAGAGIGIFFGEQLAGAYLALIGLNTGGN